MKIKRINWIAPVIWVSFLWAWREGYLAISWPYMIRQIVSLGLLTIALALEMQIHNLDLSMLSQVALSGVIFAELFNHDRVVMAFLASILFHIVIGVMKGLVISRTRIPPMIFELGLEVIFRNLWPSNENILLNHRFYGRYSHIFVWIMAGFILLVVLFEFMLERTYLGKYYQMLCENPQMVQADGANGTGVYLIIHVLASMLLFLTMLMLVYASSSGNANLNTVHLYQGIAACSISGICLTYTKNGIIRAAFGALTIVLLSMVAVLYGIYNKYYLIILGIIILTGIYRER